MSCLLCAVKGQRRKLLPLAFLANFCNCAAPCFLCLPPLYIHTAVVQLRWGFIIWVVTKLRNGLIPVFIINSNKRGHKAEICWDQLYSLLSYMLYRAYLQLKKIIIKTTNTKIFCNILYNKKYPQHNKLKI